LSSYNQTQGSTFQYLIMIWHFILWVTGVQTGPWTNFWGGFASDLPLFGVFAIIWRRIECHAPGCHRIGLHRTADGKYILCRKHHPDVKNNLTLEDIHAEHYAAVAQQNGNNQPTATQPSGNQRSREDLG
jgi:hypothetical protein